MKRSNWFPYSEGFPNIILEAAACGTPVLVAPFGAMPDVLIDEETGFLMKDNSPECIKKAVIRALNYNDSNRIVRNTILFVRPEFSYRIVVDKCTKTFEEM